MGDSVEVIIFFFQTSGAGGPPALELEFFFPPHSTV